ncbi:MAG TPA: peptidylprolyl isomerase [Candidatus Dormibacteraeota bacterium]|nr:peptidylprolyl isomerase [Candidatus Dormibacteraeota bacterium]
MTPTRPMRIVAGAVALAAILAACSGGTEPTPRPACPTGAPTADQAASILVDADHAVLVTNKGALTMELYGEAAPIATANFVALARCGYYDGISFHRVIAGFVAQVGDPQTKANRGDFDGLGQGGPGYRFAIEPPFEGLSYDPYVVSMANAAAPDTNGSQFFINLADLDDQLDRLYTIFGMVIAGTEVVDAIGQVPTNGARGVPLDAVIIESITIQAGSEEGIPQG